MVIQPRALVLALTIVLAACPQSVEPPKPKIAAAPANRANDAASASEPGVAALAAGIVWRKGDVDAAFAAARADSKPLFLYWGAAWCPPCNQVKATVFNREDFIERSRHFVPVYIDGDSPNAQKLGARFHVSGYPTMILFNPDGTEIVRLPGEADPEQYMRTLTMGMNGARPVKDTLAAALAAGHGGADLSPDDWRMLSYYSWVTDEAQLIPEKNVATTLRRLAQACPADQKQTVVRLELKAIAAAAAATATKTVADAADAERLRAVLADTRLARENFDTLTEDPASIMAYVTSPRSPARARLVADWTAALQRLAADTSLSTADRLQALAGEAALARLDAKEPELPAAFLRTVREEVARADRETTDPYARQAVIDAAADALVRAGLLDDAETLLKAELTRSHSPYYFMVDLAEVAKKRGDKAGALDWYARSYAAAQGPATRLQWGARYVIARVELAPHDVAGVEQAASKVIGEVEPSPDTFYGRNLRVLERLGKKLAEWGKSPAQGAALTRIRAQMTGLCAKLALTDPARASCDAALRPSELGA